MNNMRRIFLMTVAASSAVLTAAVQGQPTLDEKNAQALALSYVVDAAQADTRKFPKYAAGQNFASCALYQGKAGDAAGGCPLFAGEQVASKGWCSAWARKG